MTSSKEKKNLTKYQAYKHNDIRIRYFHVNITHSHQTERTGHSTLEMSNSDQIHVKQLKMGHIVFGYDLVQATKNRQLLKYTHKSHFKIQAWMMS